MDGVVVSDAKLVMAIHPSMADRVSQAVLQELGSHLFLCSHIFGRDAGVLGDIHPYTGVHPKGKFILFSFRTNTLLGNVLKLTSGSIHIVVLGFASAVIVDEYIDEELEYLSVDMEKFSRMLPRHDEEVYRSKYHKHHVIRVSKTILFQVKRFDEEIIHISGSLTAAGTISHFK